MSWYRIGASSFLLLAAAAALDGLSHGEPVKLRRTFALFPAVIGPWQAEEVRLDERVRDLLKADDVLLRAYHAEERPPVWLFLSYYASQRQGETIHSPKNCLPGAGWEPVQSGRTEIMLADGRSILVNRYVVQKGLERQLVLYWYHAHGRVVASEYWGKAYLALDAIRLNRTDGALVRVSLPLTGSLHTADTDAQEFIRELFPALRMHIPE